MIFLYILLMDPAERVMISVFYQFVINIIAQKVKKCGKMGVVRIIVVVVLVVEVGGSIHQ